MKLYCRGEYHNGPAGLHFDRVGVIELDDAKAEYVLRDAPENFSRELPPSTRFADQGRSAQDEVKAPDEPPVDKQIKAPAKKK